MASHSFATKVADLRAAWAARRKSQQLGTGRDHDSRFDLLMAIYDWAESGIAAIGEAYEGSLSIGMTPKPARHDEQQTFVVMLADEFRLTFSLVPRGDGRNDQWNLDVQFRTPSSLSAAKLGRGLDPWNRTRVEELLLSLVAAYERAQRHDP